MLQAMSIIKNNGSGKQWEYVVILDKHQFHVSV